jgi:hypothetical protein
MGIDGGGQFDTAAVGALDGFGAGAELGHGGAKRSEVIDHRLVDQNVAVGQKQNALLLTDLPVRFPQSPNNLKGGVGLAGAGCHDQQDAILPLGDGLHGCIDGVALVIAWPLVATIVVIGLQDDFFLRGVEFFPLPIFRPQFGGAGESVERQIAFDCDALTGAVVKDKAVAVAGKHEGNLQRRRVIEGLLHAVTIGELAFLGLDQGDGVVLEIQHKVGLFGFASADQFAAHNDAPFGERYLPANLGGFIPT